MYGRQINEFLKMFRDHKIVWILELPYGSRMNPPSSIDFLHRPTLSTASLLGDELPANFKASQIGLRLPRI